MKRSKALVLLDQREGEGPEAQRGDRVLYNCRLFLHCGDEVPLNERQAATLPGHMLRVDGGVTLVDHQVELGRRQVIPGIEQALLGMRVGGYRKVRISPHLAYRDKGLPSLIPANALLVAEVWVRKIVKPEARE
ncbi:MAG: FKBP-type peptidyl-prolyl cis-trans isomerase [Nitrospira sp.]|nr:FKBP-type peptidyl-prolyl cis-trans isomerase [Nitrospira sp.]MBX3343618.1 FKBP-type peptidyl-prolyl cis-trans isomerase [Nitrospira sp.]MBX7039103.1 FKBP-type peptidyl-prolyl cis-trans isomerase [Nitrospira sp.]MCW5793200.1 FKBP-type peptidyl-prolyl cis-trans isomerase [Nitrospira sp.]HMX91051.1 FKBP-type peptidyl-prolyl cis-trans isomerase [Nitrospira sp.]